ncbi:MAG TPA: hypothetical protein VGS41_02750 [Chthonomonadales bacterium]|nr:hypothetical protein [Chthonomonadales bacterium]
MRLTVGIGAALFLCLASGHLPALGQSDASDPMADFYYIFPHPTGSNGYEYLVRAGMMLSGNKTLLAAESGDATLTARQMALADPAVRKALRLLGQGLDMPVSSPRTEIDQNTRFPEYAGFRRLARTLAIRQYVLLADGKIDESIECMREGLQLGFDAQTEKIAIAGLVGIAIDFIVIRTIAVHLQQFSVADCRKLLETVQAWLEVKPPLQSMLMGERNQELMELHRARSNLDDVLSDVADSGSPANQKAAAILQANPVAAAAAVDQAINLVNAEFQYTFQSLLAPPWLRQPWAEPSDEGPEVALFDLVNLSLPRILDRYTVDRARLQLLACHAAIRKFQWEYNRLPDTLSELRLGDLATDPFSGKPFGYRQTGGAFELYSVGPVDAEHGGRRQLSEQMR